MLFSHTRFIRLPEMEAELLNSFYQTLLRGEDYYNFLLKDYINCRSYDRNQVIYQYRDRGNKYNLIWDFYISPNQTNSFKCRHSAEISYFKEWLILRTSNDIILQFSELNKYILALNSVKILNVAQHNYNECYGICMILYNILNRYYISIRKQSKPAPYNLLRLTFLYSMTFSKYHLDWDILKSVDVLSNFARMQDYFGKDTITLLLDAGISNLVGVKFMYIWAMQKCYDLLPPISIKLHYHTNARMMYQNQTVGGVTEDAFETPFFDCCKLGELYADKILQFYENKINLNSFFIDPEQYSEDISVSFQYIIKDVIKDYSINWMQFLNKTIQIEKFNGTNIISPPYIPAPIHYTYLLKKIGLTDDEITNLQEREESQKIPLVKYSIRVDNILGKSIEYGDETYLTLKHGGKETEASFRDLILMVDENKNLHSIVVTGNHLYAIKNDIDWSGLFYGIPCKVTLYDFQNRMYEDRLILAVFGISEAYDTTLFNTEN